MMIYETPKIEMTSFSNEDVLTGSWTDGVGGESTIGNGDALYAKMIRDFKP